MGMGMVMGMGKGRVTGSNLPLLERYALSVVEMESKGAVSFNTETTETQGARRIIARKDAISQRFFFTIYFV